MRQRERVRERKREREKRGKRGKGEKSNVVTATDKEETQLFKEMERGKKHFN